MQRAVVELFETQALWIGIHPVQEILVPQRVSTVETVQGKNKWDIKYYNVKKQHFQRISNLNNERPPGDQAWSLEKFIKGKSIEHCSQKIVFIKYLIF